MKELTYEDWLKNPTPRMMWVWDFDEGKKQKQKVIYLSKEDVPYKVITIAAHDTVLEKFLHCAEIEKSRRMTNKELSRWLRENPTREWKYTIDGCIHSNFNYDEDGADIACWNEIVVREDDGKWREPLVEIE